MHTAQALTFSRVPQRHSETDGESACQLGRGGGSKKKTEAEKKVWNCCVSPALALLEWLGAYTKMVFCRLRWSGRPTTQALIRRTVCNHSRFGKHDVSRAASDIALVLINYQAVSRAGCQGSLHSCWQRSQSLHHSRCSWSVLHLGAE